MPETGRLSAAVGHSSAVGSLAGIIPTQPGQPGQDEPASDDRHRLLVDYLPDAVLVHQDLRVVYANPSAQQLLGAPLSGLLGQEILRFVPEPDRDTLTSRIGLLTTVGAPSPAIQTHVLGLDGVVRSVETVAIRTTWGGGTAVQVVMRDLSQQRDAEDRFAAVVSALEEGVVTTDATGMVRSVNPAAERVFGRPERRLVGLPAAGLPLLDASGVPLQERNPLVTTHRTGEPQQNRNVAVDRPDGSRVWLTAKSRPLSLGPPCSAVLLVNDVTERRAAAAQLHYAATHDSLTGLPNRALLLDQIAAAQAFPAQQAALAVLYVDLDNFKALNDTAGHALGDEALRLVAKRLSSQVRGSDMVARLGGDEFVVLAWVDDENDSRQLAGRVLSSLARPATGRLRGHQLRASIGIVLAAHDDIRSPVDLIRDADVAMSQAKSIGRNRMAVFDAVLRADVMRRVQLENDLRDALAGSGLWVAYQPLVDLATGHWVGAEALSRWTHHTLGAVRPPEFIAVAEQSDLIHALGQRCLATACRDAVTLRAGGAGDFSVSVNVSVRQLDDPDLGAQVQDILTMSGLPAHALCLEMTESSLALDEARAGLALEPLRELGVKVSIDDFGTGYSSLARLHTLPVDELKIDRSFVTTLPTDRQARHVVAGIITLAHALDMRVVAEGVETAEHAEILAELACDLAQGYHFGRPARVTDFAASLRNARSH